MTIPSTQTIDTVIQAYRSDGYYLARGLIPGELVGQAVQWLKNQDRQALAKSWTEQEPGVELAIFSVIHKGDHPPAVIANHPPMLDLAGKLIGAPVYIWSSKVNLKAAWAGTAEYYHQDFVYWKDRGYPADRMMSCMVFLEPHSYENAGLCIFPGSHRNGFIEHRNFINVNGLSKAMVPPATLDRLKRDCGWMKVEAQPGDVLYFHTNLVHGSGHNISPSSRMILLSQLNAVGNEPEGVAAKARDFNLRRAKEELVEAQRKYDWFKKKYEEQLASEELTFCPPIPDHEKKKP
jgi:hypothetical protein